MKLTILLGLTIALPCFVLSDPQCHTSEAMACDEIATKWLNTLPKRSIPETEDQINSMCTELQKVYDCLISYMDRCMTPMQKEVVKLSIEGIDAFKTDFCSAGSAPRTKYLAHSQCLNKVSHSDEVKETIEYILAMVEKLKDIENNNKITYACCGYAKGINAFTEMGEKNCGSEAVGIAKEMIGVVFAQLPDVICNGFTGKEEKCIALLPPDGAKPTDAIKDTGLYSYVYENVKNWLD